MARPRRSKFHTVLSDGIRPDVVAKQAERRIIEEHVGRFILAWGMLDYTLGISLTAMSDSRLRNNFFEMQTHTKIEFLRSLLPNHWEPGQQLLNLLTAGNKYRNRLAHPLLAQSGTHGGRNWGWHLYRPTRESSSMALEDPDEMLAEERDAQIATTALEVLMQDPFRADAKGGWDGLSLRDAILVQPGLWNTEEDYKAFIARVESLFKQ